LGLSALSIHPSTLAQGGKRLYFDFLIMGLFDFLRKPKSKTAAEDVPTFAKELAPISYAVAYFVLPHGAFHEPDKFIAIWSDPVTPAGVLFYTMGCQFKGVEPLQERAAMYRASHGQLDDVIEYYLIEYPAPPPVNFSRLFPGKKTGEAEVPVLAPYLSAMLRERTTGAVSYYVLGQSPVGGGTTLRSVTHDGVNCNLGPGPAPQVEAFLERLRSAARAGTEPQK